jgi:hypothetical protein
VVKPDHDSVLMKLIVKLSVLRWCDATHVCPDEDVVRCYTTATNTPLLPIYLLCEYESGDRALVMSKQNSSEWKAITKHQFIIGWLWGMVKIALDKSEAGINGN